MELRSKLLGGKLKKHSEQLNKVLAGFFDSDGSIFITRLEGVLVLKAAFYQAASKDPDFEVMRALHKHYGIGSIHFYLCKNEKAASQCSWVLGIKNTKKLFNIIGKHLLIKATHFRNCIEIKELYDFRINKVQWLELKECLHKSRKESKYLKRPKYVSSAYAAGMIAGDGHVSFTRPLRKVTGRRINSLKCNITSGDRVIIDLFRETFKGYVTEKKDCDAYVWSRSLGIKNRSFAIKFLRKIRKHMLLQPKIDTINRMLKFHEAPAETKRT